MRYCIQSKCEGFKKMLNISLGLSRVIVTAVNKKSVNPKLHYFSNLPEIAMIDREAQNSHSSDKDGEEMKDYQSRMLGKGTCFELPL